MLSKQFIIALKLSGRPQYRLAQEIGVSPALLWRWTSGYQPPEKNDPRLMHLAAILDVPADKIFENFN